jgi:hypothetical protein
MNGKDGRVHLSQEFVDELDTRRVKEGAATFDVLERGQVQINGAGEEALAVTTYWLGQLLPGLEGKYSEENVDAVISGAKKEKAGYDNVRTGLFSALAGWARAGVQAGATTLSRRIKSVTAPHHKGGKAGTEGGGQCPFHEAGDTTGGLPGAL